MAGVDRAAAQALFAEAVAPRVSEAAVKQSVALQTLPVVPMGTHTTRIPVLATLPQAAFLTADQDPKPQTSVSWDKKILTAEEIAAIVPISETVIADASIDVVGTVTRLLAQAVAVTIDGAVYFGDGAPATWPSGGIAGIATAAGHTITATGNIAADMNALLDELENNGYDPTDVFAARAIRSALRSQTGTGGVPLYVPESGPSASTFNSIYGVPLSFPLGWDKATADALTVDDQAFIIGVRQDVTVKILEEATLTGFGNLAEKDSIAVRVVMRLGFQAADPVNLDTGQREYPAAILTPEPASPLARAGGGGKEGTEPEQHEGIGERVKDAVHGRK